MEKTSEKLKNLEISLEIPVKLSEIEKDKFKKVFEGLKDWLDGTHDIIIEKDRDEAYRYLRLLLGSLTKVDVDFVARATPSTKAKAEVDVLSEVAPIEEEAPEPVIRPTEEQVDGWLEQMSPKVRRKAITLVDCLKQYLDPESEVGIDIICSECSLEKMEQCIRIADPSITDSMTVFMEHQQEGL